MDRLVQALVAWGVLSAAGAWAWWVSEHRVNEVVGGVVLIVVLVGAFGVYLLVDRKRHGSWLCFGAYGALLLVSGVHAWLNGLLPVFTAPSFGAYSAYVGRLGSWGEFLLVAPLPGFVIGAILWVDVGGEECGAGRGRGSAAAGRFRSVWPGSFSGGAVYEGVVASAGVVAWWMGRWAFSAVDRVGAGGLGIDDCAAAWG